MKKLLAIVVLGLLLCGKAYAGVNEPGVTSIAGCDKGLKFQHKKFIKENLKKLLKKNQTGVLYASCDYDKYSWAVNKGKDLEKLHKKTYKQCMKYAKKHTGKECYLYAVNKEIVWKYDKAKASTIAKTKIAEAKAEQEKQAQINKKPGRFFEDQPDVNDDFQIHIIYTLYKDSKDKEGDINGKVEELIKIANDWTYKTTKKANEKSNTMNGEGQRMKFDYRKDGKLDISFIRLGVTKKEFRDCSGSGSCGNLAERTIINAGFNNPKKIYVNFGDYSFAEWHYSAGFPIFNIFSTASGSRLNKSDVGYFLLHEALHSMGGIYSCSPKHVNGHNTKKSSDMMSLHGDGRNLTLDPRNDDYWGHKNLSCPDLQDSVYFTPTSDTPFDPFEVTCLSKDKWKITKHDYKNFDDRRGKGYQCFYTRDDVTAPWEKELDIF